MTTLSPDHCEPSAPSALRVSLLLPTPENKAYFFTPTDNTSTYYVRMSSLLRKTIAAPVCLLACSPLHTAAQAQAPTPASRIEQARTLYYTPTSAGLKSFHCDVTVDWKDLLARFGAGDLPATDPTLVYLQSLKLSLDDNLTGVGGLNWVPPAGASPEDDSVAKIHGGMMQMISGFFQSWNPFLNGSYIPNLNATTTARPEGDGILVHSGDDSTSVTEHFDKNMLVTEMHVTTSTADVTAHPTFLSTPKGLIISSLKSEVHQPPAAPAMTVTMSSTYAPVSTYQLPATLTFSVQNVGDFNFKLSACQINPPAPAGGN